MDKSLQTIGIVAIPGAALVMLIWVAWSAVVRPAPPGRTLGWGQGRILDNGLIFQSRRFRRACRDYRLRQEFITPYTPEPNGMIERFFRSLKEQCTWQPDFGSFRDARSTVSRWIRWYNDERPHQALGYRSPVEHRAQQLNAVA